MFVCTVQLRLLTALLDFSLSEPTVLININTILPTTTDLRRNSYSFITSFRGLGTSKVEGETEMICTRWRLDIVFIPPNKFPTTVHDDVDEMATFSKQSRALDVFRPIKPYCCSSRKHSSGYANFSVLRAGPRKKHRRLHPLVRRTPASTATFSFGIRVKIRPCRWKSEPWMKPRPWSWWREERQKQKRTERNKCYFTIERVAGW